RFAGDDRGWHLLSLLARVERITGRSLQRIGLSATVGNPDDLLAWLSCRRGGRLVGAGDRPPEGEVTADYVGSVPNAVKVLSRMYRGERRLVFADISPPPCGPPPVCMPQLAGDAPARP